MRAVPQDVERIQKQMDILARDLHQVVAALTSLHAKNESDIEAMHDDVVALRREIAELLKAFHALDKDMAVIKTQYDLVVKAMPNNLREVHARVDGVLSHRGDPTPATGIRTEQPTQPTPPQPTPPDLASWLAHTKVIVTTWGPVVTAGAVLLMSTLRQCGVQVEEHQSATVITLPVRAPQAEPRDAGTP